MNKVIGIGNALVDLLITLEDDLLLEEMNLPKGSMTLVDEKIKDLIAVKSTLLAKDMASGGSAANTIHGLARLGVSTAFLGTVGQDDTGDFFFNDLKKSNILPLLIRSATPSGIASTLISKDGERTFGTFLGAAIELSGNNINAEHFSGYDILHVEGYLVQNHELLESILQHAKNAGLKISVDMASYNVVNDNLEFFKEMVGKYVDFLFANEEEAKAFTGKSPEEALLEMSELVEIAVVKTGSKGSMAKRGEELVHISPVNTKVTDTTGAGDLYASGFIYGLINGFNLKISGNIGSLLAARVISNIGAKIPENKWPVILAEVDKIKRL
jgi:sugar/nucleoside kinase (ribokinase family)